MKEEYDRVKLGDMYIKDFKMITIKNGNNCWSVKRKITLTNTKEEGIPILKEEAQGLAGLLDKSAILEPFKGEV